MAPSPSPRSPLPSVPPKVSPSHPPPPDEPPTSPPSPALTTSSDAKPSPPSLLDTEAGVAAGSDDGGAAAIPIAVAAGLTVFAVAVVLGLWLARQRLMRMSSRRKLRLAAVEGQDYAVASPDALGRARAAKAAREHSGTPLAADEAVKQECVTSAWLASSSASPGDARSPRACLSVPLGVSEVSLEIEGRVRGV